MKIFYRGLFRRWLREAQTTATTSVWDVCCSSPACTASCTFPITLYRSTSVSAAKAETAMVWLGPGRLSGSTSTTVCAAWRHRRRRPSDRQCFGRRCPSAGSPCKIVCTLDLTLCRSTAVLVMMRTKSRSERRRENPLTGKLYEGAALLMPLTFAVKRK